MPTEFSVLNIVLFLIILFCPYENMHASMPSFTTDCNMCPLANTELHTSSYFIFN
jgi:hypothetical protein